VSVRFEPILQKESPNRGRSGFQVWVGTFGGRRRSSNVADSL